MTHTEAGQLPGSGATMLGRPASRGELRGGALTPVARGPLLAIAGVAMLALALTSGRYGYHRDELYFIAAGAHPALGYPDQPLLAPLLARAMDLLAPGSLLVLRAPAILACGVTTVTTGLLARELGGDRRAQALAGACWAAGAVCLVTGHFVTTTTYDVCATAVVSLLIARVLRTGDNRWWLPAGAVLGLALLNKSLIGVMIGVVLVALAILGPRALLRSRWLAAGAALAVLGALPYGLWQLAHGLPQSQLAASIARSGAEGGRPGFIPFQLILIGPLLAPIWITGLLELLRNRELRALRCFAAAYLVLIPIFILTGGKAYYMSGLYPILLAAGAIRAGGWLGHRRWRTLLLTGAVALTAAISAVIGLDVLPIRDLGGSVVLKLNPDAGETVGWPRFTDTIAAVYHSLPADTRARAAIFTHNYGEAGAIAHFGPALGLPYPYSGHNGWALWGPPPNSDTTALLVGIDRQQAKHDFTGCRLHARINNGQSLNNQEQNAPILICTGERRPWSRLWPTLRHYD
ncbi:MAG: glycosyltransferase family 39 protein [Solirubrobacteraceae bacterium]